MDNRAIGIFDSGMGGLSVLKTAMKLLPTENFIYYGDNAHAPYGTKPSGTIVKLAFACANFLVARDVKAIVVACNTATSAAIRDIRESFDLPVISMEPAIKPAIEHSNGGKILMLATPATCKLERYQKLLFRLDEKHQVENVPCPGIVEVIEGGEWDAEHFNKALALPLSKFEGEHIESIVLGCTHFPFAKAHIMAYAKKHFSNTPTVYDGNEGTVRQLSRILTSGNMQSAKGGKAELHSSGDEEKMLPMFEKLLDGYEV